MTKQEPSFESVRPIWETRIDQFWSTVDLNDPHAAIAQMKRLITEFGLDDAVAHFEMASVYDAIGFETEAATEYEAALAIGLKGARLSQAHIQYGSTLRNLGRTREAIDVLQSTVPHPSIGDAAAVFLALALRDAGRTDEALFLTIEALIPHLPQYRKSATDYVRALRSASTA